MNLRPIKLGPRCQEGGVTAINAVTAITQFLIIIIIFFNLNKSPHWNEPM